MTTAMDAIDELANYSQWVVWKWVQRPDAKKPTKPPYNARTGALASSTDPSTWSTYFEAVTTADRFDGPGFVVTRLDPFCGIDLDACVDDAGHVAPWAEAIVQMFNSYTEVTPSGHGLRIFIRAKLPGEGRKRGNIEAYDRARYFTITAKRLPEAPRTIEDRQAELEQFLAEHFPERPAAPATNGHKPVVVDLADTDLLDRARGAKHGDRFRLLYDQGEWKAAGYASQSEADLALASTLLFWTNRDIARADRLFRAGALYRKKWDERHGAVTYGQKTLDKAASELTEGYTAAAPAVVTVTEPTIPMSAPETAYTFTSSLPADHFVSTFIRYAAECVDAAHDYFEVTALMLLAAATPNVRARLRQYPNGLPTAFYAILIGDSTRARKTSTVGLGLDLLKDAVPDCQLAEQASPEAFVEQLAARAHDSTFWPVDELGETLDKLHHAKYMAGLRGLLLSLYEGRPYRYKRTTKRTKAGTAVEDSFVIDNPNLGVLGATTPSIFEIVTARDVNSGFMARFAVVMPTTRPPRRGLEEPTQDLLAQRHELGAWLSRIYLWAKSGPRRVRFAGDALAIIDHFAEAIESSDALVNERARAMLQRLNAMTVKLAMIAGAGRPDALDHDDLIVAPADAAAAVTIAERWRDYAVAFGERVGETALEQHLDRALQVVRAKGRCPRRVVAQLVHCSKKTMDEIEATLEDRGLITVEMVEPKSGPSARVWVVSR